MATTILTTRQRADLRRAADVLEIREHCYTTISTTELRSALDTIDSPHPVG